MISKTPEEKSLYEFNVCNQVTLWGPDGQILDYAAKQWSGLVSQYYGKRWELFFDTLLLNLQQGESFTYKTKFDIKIYFLGVNFNQDLYMEEFLETIGKPFCLDQTKQFPVEPSGDIVTIGRGILQKWTGFIMPGYSLYPWNLFQ
jgi:hypothetical protein